MISDPRPRPQMHDDAMHDAAERSRLASCDGRGWGDDKLEMETHCSSIVDI